MPDEPLRRRDGGLVLLVVELGDVPLPLEDFLDRSVNLLLLRGI